VRKVLKQFRGRVLLADEVGLGKTVEAGMRSKSICCAAWSSGCWCCPASLVGQWRENWRLNSIFPAPPPPTRYCERTRALLGAARIIASLALARRREHAERLIAQSFDIVIVDEAHHLRDRASQSYKLVDGLSKRFLLLLSATPVQNNLIELYNLLTLLKPAYSRRRRSFAPPT